MEADSQDARQAKGGVYPHRIAWLLLSIHAMLLGWQCYHDSPTWDEVGHFAAAADHWHHGRFRLFNVNPPLIRMIGLLPVVVFRQLPDMITYPGSYEAGQRPEFVVGAWLANDLGRDYFTLMVIARIACIPFSILGGWVCYRWSSEVWGHKSGLMSLALWTFSPSVLAYGHLLLPDLGAASVGVFAVYLLRKWLDQPRIARALVAGLVLGLAELSKTTWIVLFPVWPVLWIVDRARSRRRSGTRRT